MPKAGSLWHPASAPHIPYACSQQVHHCPVTSHKYVLTRLKGETSLVLPDANLPMRCATAPVPMSKQPALLLLQEQTTKQVRRVLVKGGRCQPASNFVGSGLCAKRLDATQCISALLRVFGKEAVHGIIVPDAVAALLSMAKAAV